MATTLAGASFTGGQSTKDYQGNSTLQSTLVRDVDPKVFFLNADTAPLTALIKKAKGRRTRKVESPKFEWIEKEMGTPVSASTGAVASGDSTVDVTSGHGSMFTADDLVYFPETGEQALVTGVSTDTLTITRGYGSSTGSTTASTTVALLGNINEENGTSPTARALLPVEQYNYTSILKHAAEAARTATQSEFYDIKDGVMQERRKEAMLLHMEAMERIAWFGERNQDLSGVPKRATRGVLNWISTNKTDAGGTFTRAKLVDFLKQIYLYGGRDKVFFVGGELLEAMDNYIFDTAGNTAVNLTPASTSFGIDVRMWTSAFGKIKIIYNRTFNDIHPDMGVALDMDHIKFAMLQDTKMRMNVQPNDQDGFKDQILTEFGVQLMNEKRHGIFEIG